MATAPHRAEPSPLVAPDRVVEHVLHSLASLPLEEAVEQAFTFSDVGEPDDPHGYEPVSQRRSWLEGAFWLLDRDGFRRMLLEDFPFLLGRLSATPLRYLAPPQWTEDDRHVSFLVAADNTEMDAKAQVAAVRHPSGSLSASVSTRARTGPTWGSALSVALHRPEVGSHRDCWLVSTVALRAVSKTASEVVDEDWDLRQHSDYQESVFDGMADFFASPAAIPPEVVPRLQRIAQTCSLDGALSVLDVATGTGALLPFFEAEGANIARVTGVDLSEGMLAHARARHPEATFVKADILNFTAPEGQRFDRVVFNAVFGNLFDQAAVLRHVQRAVVQPEGGIVVISHPLGRRWLRDTLHKKDPKMVPHDLPSEADLHALLKAARAGSLSVVSVEDEPDYYCAVLRSTAAPDALP